MFVSKKKIDFVVPESLRGLIEKTRPVAVGTLARLERKLHVVRQMHDVARGDAARAERFAEALQVAAEGRLCRQRPISAALEVAAQEVYSGRMRPEQVFREICVAAAGALHRHAVDDLRGVLSVIHASGLAWPACDPPALNLSDDDKKLFDNSRLTPAPQFLRRADALRASGVRGGIFAAWAAEGLGVEVAVGMLPADEAEAAWAERPLWRPGELDTLVSYLQ